MFLLPYERLTISTSLSAQEVMSRLASVIEPPGTSQWFDPNHKPYQGALGGNRFAVQRISSTSKSYLPQIQGLIVPTSGGSHVELTLSLHIGMLVIGAALLGSLGVVFLYFLTLLLLSRALSALPIVLAPLAAMILIYGLVVGIFKLEAARSQAFFRKLLAEQTIK